MSTFPAILLHVVNSDQYPNAVGWGPNGNLWIDPSSFQQALQDHFPGVTKFASFTRKLNRYGFRKVSERNGSLERVVHYEHKTFRQGISMAVASAIRIEKKNKQITPRNASSQPVAIHEKDQRCALASAHKKPAHVRMNLPPMCSTACVEAYTSSSLQGLLQRQYYDWLPPVRTPWLLTTPTTTATSSQWNSHHTFPTLPYVNGLNKYIDMVDVIGTSVPVPLDDLFQSTVVLGTASSLPMSSERPFTTPNPSLRYGDVMIPRADVPQSSLERSFLWARLYSLLRH